MTGRVLLVGPEQPLWKELRAGWGAENSAWKTEFAESGEEALALLARFNYTAVVADIHLPDMRGLELLDEVLRRQPKVVRIVVSEVTDTVGTVQCIGTSHHHLMKPCDIGMLLSALNQALAVDAWLPSETAQSLIGQMRWVPSPPELYFHVASEMQSPTASVERIGQLIAQDPAIAAKVLQLANSAAFGLHLEVLEPVEAVSYLGLETTKALVLLAHTFTSFRRPELAGFSIESLWHHAVITGRFARRIAQAERCGSDAMEESSAGGLLHDIGKLLLAANLPERFGRALALAREERRALWEVENQLFGASHAELGASLLGIWGLPGPIVGAVAAHHQPSKTNRNGFSPVIAVHVANALAHETHPEANRENAQLDLAYLCELGLDQRVEDWRELCLELETEPAVS